MPIRLKAAEFAPTLGETPDLPPGLAIAGYPEETRGYYIVQFEGPVEPLWRTELEAIGGEVLAYLPEFAFKVRMTPAEARVVERLSSVTWVGIFHPAYKLSPDIVREGIGQYRVRLAEGAEPGLAAAEIAATGARVLQRTGNRLVVAAGSAQLDAVARVLDVAWIENFAIPEKHNEYAGGVIMGANEVHTNGFDGSGQTIGIADTGLGDGSKGGAHPDLSSSRIAAIYDWQGEKHPCYRIVIDGAQDVDSGHGTHVAVSALGEGGATGTAPGADLVFQAVENYVQFRWTMVCATANDPADFPDGYYLIGIPADLRELFQQAYDAGARIHSNSWGSRANGAYTSFSADADDFVWNHPDMAIAYSAGNAGPNPGTTAAPATAKNVIAVGASENDRQGDYACHPALSGTCTGANVTGATADNPEQMADFSSRGPTDDGRIKPDVVAPGTWVLSGYSSLFQEGDPADTVNPQNGLYQWNGWGDPPSLIHKYMGGTSMSAPLVAGAAAVVRQFYESQGHAASAALVKATLINSAIDLLDEDNDGVNDNAIPIPNDHEGWGRVNLANATDGSREFVDETIGVATNESRSYPFESTDGALKVSLVWSDFPSTESAADNLVNDLDLSVVVPDGITSYRGNNFNNGWSTSGGSADRINNVENVFVATAEAGSVWTVTVKGHNVPNGPQPFALVIKGAVLASEPPPPPANTIHVGDLDGSATDQGRKWTANVIVTVHDASEGAVSEAEVRGSWDVGGNGTCITDVTGQCTVSRSNLNANKMLTAMFSVTDVIHSSLSYDAASNHDADNDSDGTMITVSAP